jgi:hypothetical protein
LFFFATDGIYFSDDEEGYLLRLPPPVVQLGRVGMIISLMELGARCDNGVFEPFNDCPLPDGDERTVYGNVYLP